jgi:hypothetical protein
MALSVNKFIQEHGDTWLIIEGDFKNILSRGTSLAETKGYSVRVWPDDCKLTTITPILTKEDPSFGCHINIPEQYWVGHALDILIDKIHERGKLPTYMGLDPLLDAFISEKFKQGAPS